MPCHPENVGTTCSSERRSPRAATLCLRSQRSYALAAACIVGPTCWSLRDVNLWVVRKPAPIFEAPTCVAWLSFSLRAANPVGTSRSRLCRKSGGLVSGAPVADGAWPLASLDAMTERQEATTVARGAPGSYNGSPQPLLRSTQQVESLPWGRAPPAHKHSERSLGARLVRPLCRTLGGMMRF